ncbi:MAG: hypothetical protein Q9181_002533 [Wetmoreana brouardii]
MSSTEKPPPRTPYKLSGSSSAPTSTFLQQRDALVGEISVAMEQVLQNINKLNRSLEGVIAVGNEFGAVEALWSQFENVMTKDPGESDEAKSEGHEGADDGKDEEQETQAEREKSTKEGGK